VLKVDRISVFYGQIQALWDVSIEVELGEIVAIIGANGAGKTSLIKTVMGINKPASGSIWFNDMNITKEPTHSIVKNGVTCIPEGRRVFPKLTVRENLEMGCYSKRLNKNLMERQLERVYHLFPRLKERKGQLGGTLSGGEQQMLAIGRGLMNNPKLLLLDEPSLGLAPIVVDDMFEIIQKINKEEKIPVLLVEQNAYSALEISNRAYALELGHIVKSGFSQSLLRDSDIIKSYLGG
jgi:branched-chain amino acid transport system ATP-binding protein